jgi:carbon storage regulator CsrA
MITTKECSIMLVLTRKVNEEILIGDNIRIKIVDIGAGRIRIGVSAPRDVTVLRDEVIRDFDRPAIESAAVPASVEACSAEPCTSV